MVPLCKKLAVQWTVRHRREERRSTLRIASFQCCPEALSNGVCSLNAGEDKLTFSAIIELDKQGTILSYRFRKSVIQSKVRGVYSEVNQLFDGTADKALRKNICRLSALCTRRGNLRRFLKRAQSGVER